MILSNSEPNQRRRWRKSLLKSEFTLFQGLLLLFHAIQFFKCWRFFLELNSKGLYLGLKKELKKSLSPVHVVVVQPPQRNAQKIVKNEQSLLSYANLNQSLSCPLQCRRLHRCLNSLVPSGKTSECKNLRSQSKGSNNFTSIPHPLPSPAVRPFLSLKGSQ